MNTIEVNKKAIIVPVDFSVTSQNALMHAADHSSHFGNDIVLVHVVEERYMSSLFGGQSRLDLIKAGVETKLQELKTKVLSKYPDLKVDFYIQTGRVYKSIIEISEKMDCDSIIMGTNGAEGFEHIIGSTASRVMSYAEKPVIIVNEFPQRGRYDRIILPIDLSLESRQKVIWAIHIAKKYNSEVHIISEIEDDEFLQNKIRATIYQVKNALEQNDIKTVIFELDEERFPGNLGIDCLKYADEVDGDLILIMTHQEKGFSEYIFGSEAQQIVNRVKKVPVMCIHPVKTAFKYIGTEGFY